MLSFAHPEWLALLALAPLVYWRRWRRPRAALRLPNLSALALRDRSLLRWADALGRALIVALLALAAAGPRVPDLKTRLPSEGIAIAVVVDVSGSMATPDFAPAGTSRLDAAKRAFTDFLASRGNDAVALVAFAATPRTECPPTLNHTVLSGLMEKLESRSGVDAGTNIGDAIVEALLRMQNAPAKRKVIVLLTDGEHNATGDGADAPLTPRQAAQLAANLNIPLYAIDCGGEPNATDADAAKQRQAGRAILQACADLTGGKAFTANDADQLHAALREIDTLERTTIESYQYRRYFDYGLWCGLAALAVWLTLTSLEATVWRTLP